jgi:hybrid cluster-associated redox disulfide protein
MIDKKMSIEEIVKRYPETIAVFEKYGLGCAGCQAALFEDIQQGAEVHGIDIDTLLNSLNQALEKDRR